MPEQTAAKILALAKNPKLAKDMGAHGYKKASKIFSMKKMIQSYEKIAINK